MSIIKLESSTVDARGICYCRTRAHEGYFEECPWTISTSMGGTERTISIMKAELSLKLNQEDVENTSFMKVKAIVTEAKSYDVLVGTTMLYPMGFTLDFWEEIASYRPR